MFDSQYVTNHLKLVIVVLFLKLTLDFDDNDKKSFDQKKHCPNPLHVFLETSYYFSYKKNEKSCLDLAR